MMIDLVCYFFPSSLIVIFLKKLLVQIETTTAFNSIFYPTFCKLPARVIFFKKQLFYQSINNQSHSILLRFKEDIVICSFAPLSRLQKRIKNNK